MYAPALMLIAALAAWGQAPAAPRVIEGPFGRAEVNTDRPALTGALLLRGVMLSDDSAGPRRLCRTGAAIAAVLSPLLAVVVAALGVNGECRADGGLAPATLSPGELYFRLGGTPRFLLGRNPTGWETGQFEPLLDWARDSGEKLVRIHLTVGRVPRGPAGEVDEAWARGWDQVLDLAAEDGLYVLPVFGAWSDWNDGTRGEAWHRWEANPYNAVLGGPAQVPAELLGDTACRRQWLGWMEALVKRWRDRPEVIGWEVFSELDRLSGATEEAAVEFMQSAADVVRAADPNRRPVTASLAGINEWPQLFASDALDIVQVHPYADLPPYRGELSALILDCVRQRMGRYHRPVLIGECGLDSRSPSGALVISPGAPVEINHAIWAALVSGAANGRMLWWEDGYDQYSGLDLRTVYCDASASAAGFVADVDFTGFAPLDVQLTDRLRGAAVGSAQCIIGWFKDARCVPPDWPLTTVEGQSVALSVTGAAATWHAEFCDPRSGAMAGSAQVLRQGDRLDLPLPAFEGSIAVRLTPAAAQ